MNIMQFNFCCVEDKIYTDREQFRKLCVEAETQNKHIVFGNSIEELYEHGDLVLATENAGQFTPYSEPMHFSWHPWVLNEDNTPMTTVQWFEQFYEIDEDTNEPEYLVYAFYKKVGNNYYRVAHKDTGYGEWIID